jgi:hypothetical protein
VSLRGHSLLIVAVLLCACAREEYRNADLQLDILAPLPAHADRIRICVEGVRSRTMGAGGARYALPGLPEGSPAAVQVDALVELDGGSDSGLVELITVARSVQVTLSNEEPWLETELEVFAHSLEQAQACQGCPAPCGTTTTAAETEEESWLLTARFQG